MIVYEWFIRLFLGCSLNFLEVIVRLPSGLSHLVVFVFGLILSCVVYGLISGEGTYHILFLDFNKNKLAQILGFISFNLYGRWCYERPILPNQQGIQLFLGTQTGEVWKEGSFLFIPRPFWSIWKQLSVMDFSFTVAAQNRTKEGHLMMVFATGRATPLNAYMLARISLQGLEEQVLGLSMAAIGTYINMNARISLLHYQSFDISRHVSIMLGENKLYGLDVQVFTTKVIEISQETVKQFDLAARKDDMQKSIQHLRESFPEIPNLELYAMYASLVGIRPAVMSYMVHSKGDTNVFIGKGDD